MPLLSVTRLTIIHSCWRNILHTESVILEKIPEFSVRDKNTNGTGGPGGLWKTRQRRRKRTCEKGH